MTRKVHSKAHLPQGASILNGYLKAGMAPWFDMLNHSPMNNAEFTYNADESTLYVQYRDITAVHRVKCRDLRSKFYFTNYIKFKLAS